MSPFSVEQIMRALALAALPVILTLVTPSLADAKALHLAPVKVKKIKGKRVAVAMADAEPRTRIRGAQDPSGLTPLEFAKWLRAHPRLAADPAAVRNISAPTRLLNRSSEHFAEADRNGDGRVSADELADFVQPEAITPMRVKSPTT